MSVHIIDNRMKAFEQSVSNAVILGLQGATWETALSKITEETRALILGSAKSEVIGLRLIQELEQLLPKASSDQNRLKQVLLHVIKGFPEPADGGEIKATLMAQDSFQEILTAIKSSCDIVFKEGKERRAKLMSGFSPLQLTIMSGIGQSMKEYNPEMTKKIVDNEEVARHLQKMADVNNEIKFHSATHTHLKAIERIEILEQSVLTVNQEKDKPLSHQELRGFLKEARASMQVAEQIMLELSSFEDLEIKKLRSRVDGIKKELRVVIDHLNAR
ncbi:MAG: hypothetical protein ACM3JI_01385, partial [Anaerolineae bacterium]